MPVTAIEKPDSGQATTGSNASRELLYVIRGTAATADAADALVAAAPDTVVQDGRTLVFADAGVEPVYVDSGNPDACIWDGSARYALPEKVEKEVGESSFSFDTAGGTQHVTQSLATINKHAPAGKTAPDFKGAIGVTTDSVEGVDITVPVYEFSETHVLADATVTTAYKGALFALTGKVNNATFKGLAAGECLFLGASGSKRGDGDWEISFRFAASPNKTGLTVGDITGIAKNGWEYLWVLYAAAEDGVAKALVQKPIAAYVEKVYETADFAGLGI